MTDKYSFVKGFVFAAFMTLSIFETAELYASLNVDVQRFDGYCSLTTKGCTDTGCKDFSTEGSVYMCQRSAKKGDVKENICDCQLIK